MFKITDLRTCRFYLGVKVSQTADGVFLGQPVFIDKIIQDAHVTTAKPTKSPLPVRPCIDEHSFNAILFN